MNNRDAFLRLIREDVLKLSLAELDFGIYRILRHRRAEIDHFLDERLPILMEEALGGTVQTRQDAVRQELGALRDELNQSARGLGLETAFSDGALIDTLSGTPRGRKYTDLNDQLRRLEAQTGLSQSEEDRLYNALYVFFSRYYRDGDFLTQPRRGRDARYLVHYGGSDVHVHWRSRNSHYVKTTETLTSYTYEQSGRRVVFALVEVSEEQDNVKGKTRYFLPQIKKAKIDRRTGEFVLPFAFRALNAAEVKRYGKAKSLEDEPEAEPLDGATEQERIITEALGAIQLPPELTRDTFAHHLRRYARKNRTDYFVHPYLGDFLRTELDHYLKTEFLDAAGFTDGSAVSDQVNKLRALKTIGDGLIELLDQVECFQSQLFEKRRFVLRTDYLVPIRLLPRELWSKIIASDAQVKAWRDLFSIAETFSEDTLSAHPTLVVDTCHFDDAFKLRLLAAFDDLDEITDGTLIQAENYGALRTLGPLYRQRIKTIYLDPPYNTGSDGFLYKDDFARHSTWLSMMDERLRLGRDLLTDDGVIFVSIDDIELPHLRMLMEKVFGAENKLGTMVWKGATDNNPTRIAIEHEYILCFAKDATKTAPVWKNTTDATKTLMLDTYAEIATQISDLAEQQRVFRLFIRENRDSLKPLTHYDRIDSEGPYTGGRKVHNPGKEGYRYDVIHPVTGKPCKAPARGYRFPESTMKDLLAAGRIIFGADENQIIQIKEYLKEYAGGLKGVVELDSRVGANALEDLFGSREVFRNPKPVELLSQLMSFTSSDSDTVMDFFAGSGTFGQATIDLNREDGNRRKFLLVDMGEYFDSVLVPRIIKSMYSPSWDAGKPQIDPLSQLPLTEKAHETPRPDTSDSSPRLVKVMRLESFEDSLNALELAGERDARMRGQMSIFGDDYLLKYLLPIETEGSAPLLNAPQLEYPFAYSLRVHTNDGLQEVPIDLVETANLLLGLRVQRIYSLRDGDREYRLVEGLRDDHAVLIVWRDVAGLDPAREVAFLQESFTLDRYATIYTNADSALPRSQSLDPELKRLMLARDLGAV